MSILSAQKIVSHKPPRHMDDWGAIALTQFSAYRKLGHELPVDFVAPQDEILAVLRQDPATILIDVGGDYNPALNNYDHHHNPNLPSSLILVAQELPIRLLLTPAIRFIDLADRVGVKKAAEELKVPLDRNIDEMRKTILLSAPNADAGEAFLIANGTAFDYNSFIKTLYKEMDKRGLLEEAKKKIEEEKRAFEEKLNKAQIYEIKGLRVVYLPDTSFAPLHYQAFQRLNADIIIEQNSMNPAHTSIIKNTASEKTKNVDLSRVFQKYPKVFLHNTGFIAVIEVPAHKVKPEDVVNLVTEG